jgi:hypothetical protein
MNGELHYRRYLDSDNPVISGLACDILGASLTYSHWKWKYQDNPAGKALSAVAVNKDKIVGQIGAIPVRFSVNGIEIVGSQEVDIAVQTAHRKPSTFYTLCTLRLKINEENNIGFCYGFTVDTTSKLSQTVMHFKQVGTIARLVKVLDPEPFLKKRIPLKGLPSLLSAPLRTSQRITHFLQARAPKGTQIKKVSYFDYRFDSLWNRVKGDYPIMTVRDTQYLNWRYIDIPDVAYDIFSIESEYTSEILGFIVLREKHDTLPIGQIVDIVTSRGQDGIITRTLLAEAVRLFWKKKVALVTCWMFSHCHVFSELIDLGFQKREKEGRHLVFRNTNLVNPALPNEIAMNMENWYLCIGDSDFY